MVRVTFVHAPASLADEATKRQRQAPSPGWPAPRQTAASLHLLHLQRTAGNRAAARLVALQRCGPTPPDQCPCHDGEVQHSESSAARAEVTTIDGVPPWAVPAVLQRQSAPSRVADGRAELHEDDPRLNDPGFLICLAFCYLGVPPSIFKDLMQAMLECLSAEMRAADSAGYESNFAAAREELATYGKLRLLGKILRFVLHGELGPGGIIKVTRLGAPIRERIIARMVALGASRAGLVAAEAVVRKVLLVIDAAIVAGCAAYCGAVQAGRALVQFTEAVAQGITGAMQVLSGISNAVAGVLADAVLSVYGQGNPANWVLSPALPQRTRADLAMLGATLWMQVRPGSPWTARRPGQSDADQLLANGSRTLDQYRVPHELMESVAASLQSTIAAAGGSAQVSADDLMQMSYLGLVAFLRDNGMLRFGTDPITFAHRELSEQAPATQ